MFSHDPEIKRECIWRGSTMDAKSICADRRSGMLRVRGSKGSWQDVELYLAPNAGVVLEYSDPFNAPELIQLRDMFRSWRFYDSFRTDQEAAARRISIGSCTPIMSADGSNLASAMQTIREIGDSMGLDRAIEDAFPGSSMQIEKRELGIRLTLQQPGMLRKLSVSELSDGTLRFLLLAAALFTPRPPEFMVLNEPENSLHPELIPALSRMILAASSRCQVIVVTHCDSLVQELSVDDELVTIRLRKQLGETVTESENLLNRYGWKWPAR
jgi:predicted ATPase